MRAPALLLIVSCSSSSPRPASAPPPTPAPRCPATFASANGHCTMREGEPCAFPEGTCRCGPPVSCGGARPPEYTEADYVWECTPNVRADGCPGATPVRGADCTREAQQCVYTCGCLETATCTSGAWTVVRGACAK